MEVIALSFGAGIQTAALALMLEDGHIEAPRPAVAIFADTQAEPPHVYETLDWIRPRLSYPLIVTSLGDLYRDTLDSAAGKAIPHRGRAEGRDYVDIPIFKPGSLFPRQCTSNYKILPIHRAIREWAGERPPRLKVRQYMGISTDEAHRMKDSRVAYIRHDYPLIDAGLSRADCEAYLAERYPDNPVGKSSCFFCPYHSATEWRNLLTRYPALAERAADMDDTLRESIGVSLTRQPAGLRKYLAEIEAQQTLPLGDGWGNECEGHCGV